MGKARPSHSLCFRALEAFSHVEGVAGLAEAPLFFFSALAGPFARQVSSRREIERHDEHIAVEACLKPDTQGAR